MDLITDYDVEISQILLAHHYIIYHGGDVGDYRKGRNMHGMVCPISGGGKYIFADGESIFLMPGDIGLIPAEAAYRVVAADERPFEHYTVNFLANADSFPDWMPRNKPFVLKSKNVEPYLAKFEELVKTWQRMRICYRIQAKSMLLALLADFFSECITLNVDAWAYHHTLPARKMIENHYSEPITLSKLAEVCGMGVASFRRAFASVYGHTPIAYLLNLRIKKASELLLMGLTLEEVAGQTGFSDVNYFIRYFKKVTGVTPGKYRHLY